MSKTIGILGGMGTFATLHFLKYLTELSEPDEFNFIVNNAVDILERSKAVKEGRENEVEEGLMNAIFDLCYVDVDFVVAPCNQVHYWHKNLRGMFSIPWLNMIEIVADAVKAKGYKHPLILGGSVTVEKELYSDYLPITIYLPKAENEKIYEAIKAIKRYKVLRFNAKVVIEDIIARYTKKCDSVILACTELPITFNMPTWKHDFMIGDAPIIDSSLELAKATVAYARG